MQATYEQIHSDLDALWDKVIDEREPLTIHRDGSEDLVLMPATEWASLGETAHLLRSPKNAQRLLEALATSLSQSGEMIELQQLRTEVLQNES